MPADFVPEYVSRSRIVVDVPAAYSQGVVRSRFGAHLSRIDRIGPIQHVIVDAIFRITDTILNAMKPGHIRFILAEKPAWLPFGMAHVLPQR